MGNTRRMQHSILFFSPWLVITHTDVRLHSCRRRPKNRKRNLYPSLAILLLEAPPMWRQHRETRASSTLMESGKQNCQLKRKLFKVLLLLLDGGHCKRVQNRRRHHPSRLWLFCLCESRSDSIFKQDKKEVTNGSLRWFVHHTDFAALSKTAGGIHYTKLISRP